MTTDLLILGDSFCAARSKPTDWPVVVQNSLSANLRGQGFPGASWWSVRNSLTQHIKTLPNIAIFCHTEPNRLPHANDWALNSTTAQSGIINNNLGMRIDTIPFEFTVACKLYYKHLWYQEYQDWAMTKWLYELDDLTKNIEIVLHFFGFDNIHCHHRFQHGVSFSDPLTNYAKKSWHPDFRNHFDADTNQRFADVVLEHIHNYPGAGALIDKKLALC